MRFSTTTTTSVLFSILVLGAVGAPAPQYDTTMTVSTTVEATATAAGSAVTSDSVSATASAATSRKACKAKTGKAQWGGLWRQHQRPPPSASGENAPPFPPNSGEGLGAGQKPSAGLSSYVAPTPSWSEVQSEPSAPPTDTSMTSAVESAESVTATAIQAGGDQGGAQSSASSQVAWSSMFEASSTYESPAPQPSTSAPSSDQGGGGGGASVGFEADILKAHNAFRATWGPLVWNQTLADLGSDYFKTRNCVMEHSGMYPGENLSKSFGGGAFSGQSVSDMWAAEASDWPLHAEKPPTGKKANGDEIMTGHFTQQVWKATTQLGCGQFTCGGDALAFCEYWPRGNVFGQYKDQVGTTS